jgi:hypothetical protein
MAILIAKLDISLCPLPRRVDGREPTETNGVQGEEKKGKRIRKCKNSKTSFMGRSDEKRQ